MPIIDEIAQQNEIFQQFDALCRKQTPFDAINDFEMAKKLFEKCPSAATYCNLCGDDKYQSFLRSAVDNKQDKLCAYLLDNGCNPLMTFDIYQSMTMYDYVYVKLWHEPKDKQLQNIMNSMRQHIPVEQKAFWLEKEKFLADREKKSQHANRVIMSGTIAFLILASAGICKIASKENVQTEPVTEQIRFAIPPKTVPTNPQKHPKTLKPHTMERE